MQFLSEGNGRYRATTVELGGLVALIRPGPGHRNDKLRTMSWLATVRRGRDPELSSHHQAFAAAKAWCHATVERLRDTTAKANPKISSEFADWEDGLDRDRLQRRIEAWLKRHGATEIGRTESRDNLTGKSAVVVRVSAVVLKPVATTASLP